MNKYRDKNDYVKLPEIPTSFVDELNSLEFTRENPIKGLETIYGYMNKYNSIIKQVAVCEKGCSFCCYVDVSITDLEARYISEKTHHKIKNLHRITLGYFGKKCPFLSDSNECSIYDSRPFHCRTLHALDDPKYCKTNESHQIYGTADPRISPRYGSNILERTKKAIDFLDNHKQIRDIRDFFVTSL